MDCKDIPILIIDDVQSMRTEIKQILLDMGFLNLLTAENGLAATLAADQSFFADTPIQLFICDWHMEPMNGLEFLNFIKQHPIYYNIPFIMLTAEDTKENVLEAITQGVDDYIIKPLTPDKVATRVYGALKKRGLL